MLDIINFKNYKLFKHQQRLELRPITVLIGKNSSGKSAVLKLPTLIEGSLSGEFSEPLRLNNNGIELGLEFKDLLYGRTQVGRLNLTLESRDEKVEIIIGKSEKETSPEIMSWKHNDNEISFIDSKEFKGFIRKSEEIKSLSLQTDYITSIRETPKRHFDSIQKGFKTVGHSGENVYNILLEDFLSNSPTLLEQVSDFYKKNFEGWELSIEENSNLRYQQWQIEMKNDQLRINIKDVGLGMIHALPLVVRALMPCSEEQLIIIEEPELHLHPAAHGNLAELFVDSLKDTNKRYLIETHSQNFVLRLRRLVAEERVSKEYIAIYYVDFDEEKEESILKEIRINELGGVDYWPPNVFSETLDETSAIRSVQINKQSNGR